MCLNSSCFQKSNTNCEIDGCCRYCSIAEENRLKELKAKCEKKGLNSEEEEAKYQAKLAEKKAKAEAKAAKPK